MSRKSSLVKNTAILSLGTFFPKFVTVLVTPILTKQLAKADYGHYDMITTVVSLLLPIATLQISTAAFRFLIDKRKSNGDCQTIISTIYSFVLISSIITCFIYFLIEYSVLGSNSFLVCLYFFVDILLITTQQVMRGLGKNLMYSVSTIIRAVVDVLLIALLTGIIPSMKNYSLTGVIVAMILSTFISFVFLIIKGGIFQFFSLRYIKLQQLKTLLSYSWPMIPNNLSMWVLRLSDRLVITAILGFEANAIYAVANKLPTIFSAFQSTFTLAWQENASFAVKDKDKDIYYSHMFDWIFTLLTGVMACLIAFTPILWLILVRGDYDEAYYQLPILYLGMIFLCMSSALGGIYVAHMKTKSLGITTMIAAIINLLIDLLFVRHIGIWAGSISTMVAYLFLCIFRMVDIQKFQRIEFNKKKIIISIIIIVLMAILNFQQQLVFDLINGLICIFVLVLFERKIISNVFSTVIHKLKKKDS